MNHHQNRSHFHDQINSTTIWHDVYDGRAVRGASYDDHAAGLPFEENHKKFKEAASAGDNSRAVTWAYVFPFPSTEIVRKPEWRSLTEYGIYSGTAVGLVKDQKPAGEIVKEVREEAKARIKKIQVFAA